MKYVNINDYYNNTKMNKLHSKNYLKTSHSKMEHTIRVIYPYYTNVK